MLDASGASAVLLRAFLLDGKGLTKNMRLTQENRFLQMQAAQYRILQKSIEDTRRARHDLRQHFKALQGCVESGDIDRVAEYVKACRRIQSAGSAKIMRWMPYCITMGSRR